jgi:hypothetical protein
MPFIIFMGGLQCFLLAMVFIWVWQRPRRQNAP